MEAFDSFRQNPQNGAYFLVRTTGNAAASTPTIRGIVRDLDPSLALYSAQTMDDLRSRSMAKAKFLTVLLVMFAAIGVALSVVGVYGALARDPPGCGAGRCGACDRGGGGPYRDASNV